MHIAIAIANNANSKGVGMFLLGLGRRFLCNSGRPDTYNHGNLTCPYNGSGNWHSYVDKKEGAPWKPYTSKSDAASLDTTRLLFLSLRVGLNHLEM